MTEDDWPFFPQQFGTGSAHDLRDAPEADYRPSRLKGLRSVKNKAGGLLTAPAPPAPEPVRQAMGFAPAPTSVGLGPISGFDPMTNSRWEFNGGVGRLQVEPNIKTVDDPHYYEAWTSWSAGAFQRANAALMRILDRASRRGGSELEWPRTKN